MSRLQARRHRSAREGPSSAGGGRSYGRLAEFYDRVYSWKDYRRESEGIRRLVRRWGPSPARTLLDVGCGTGEHLRYLARRFECTGLDPSSQMLAVARKKLPAVRWERGAMPAFDLGRSFDVVICLFSAIGYVRDASALRATLRTFARHLNAGGIVLVEPWLTPDVWKPGSVHLLSVPSPTEPLARMNSSVTEDGRSVMEMHYLAALRGRVVHWKERHVMSLFTDAQYRAAFRSAGLTVHRLRSGFTSERGIYLGRKSPPRTGRKGRRPS